jgi:heptosyltransferase-1
LPVVKILIIKPSSLGDVVHALPVLRLLRRAHPEARIDWWLAPGLFPLLQDDPDLDNRIPFHKRDPYNWLTTLLEVRATRYDLVIDLQGLARSGAMCWLAGGGHSIGLDLNREGARGFYDETVPRPARNAHAVEWYLEVARRLGIPITDDFEWLPRREGEHPAPDTRRIALIPGARWNNKRWPAPSFRHLIRILHARQPDLRFSIHGDAGDRPLARQIAEGQTETVSDKTGTTSLPELVEQLRDAALVVTNDTGPMHIAAALGRPVVALFGPTDHRQTGPYGTDTDVLRIELPCAPCFKSRCRWSVDRQCLNDLAPETVAAAVMKRLPK